MLKLSNRFWFVLHGWLSLPIWLVFCFVCLTGTIAVFSHELTWLTNSAARANNPDNVPALSAAVLVEKVQQAYPTADVGTVMVFEPYLVNAVVFTDHDKPQAIAYVNQYSGEIQSVEQGITFIGFMRALHGWLMFPWHGSYSIGYYLVSGMAVLMLGSLITGLVVYKHFWRAFTQPKIRTQQGQRTLLADLHRLAGVWSIWFLLVMSLTGLWYLIQAIFWHADIDIEPHPPLVNVAQLPAPGSEDLARPVSFAQALEKVQQLYPDFKPAYLHLPEHNRDMYILSGGGDHVFYDQYAYRASINPWTGEVASSRSPEQMTVLQTLTYIADPLHYGTIGGIWTKIIWFVFGLVLTGMSITGFMMWGLRTFKGAAKVRKAVDIDELGETV
ncbi:PepSY-associated TM helix domain-containing protein [Bowmanella yangjiangensis]|uniref:PepSY domain-containing protein n=1 Tax=Bowmanella yangjiangensis TaxID=2811230 RepID=A0ABS3CS65_9ALTE|nr:PepSY-associated TM helix domain-containing protein [Bowmanella yangjiangensis]MBN7819266.1 PepSY domain-containing protein [Bowmanella yangjiangensis]